MNNFEMIEMELNSSSDEVLVVEEEQHPVEEKKPLMVWFDAFEVELEKLGGNYKNSIEPTDMLELYYEGVTPEDSASKLMLESKNKLD